MWAWTLNGSLARAPMVFTRRLTAVAGAHEGERNNLLNWGAWTLRSMINSGELDYSSGAEARTALLEVGMSIGLPRAEVERTIKSAMGG